jgi:hypothetical protein
MDAFTLSEPELTRARSARVRATRRRRCSGWWPIWRPRSSSIGSATVFGLGPTSPTGPLRWRAAWTFWMPCDRRWNQCVMRAARRRACFAERARSGCVSPLPRRVMIRREMHFGKVVALHVGSAGRVLMAWDDEALNEVLASGSGPVYRRDDHRSRVVARQGRRYAADGVCRYLRRTRRGRHGSRGAGVRFTRSGGRSADGTGRQHPHRYSSGVTMVDGALGGLGGCRSRRGRAATQRPRICCSRYNPTG